MSRIVAAAFAVAVALPAFAQTPSPKSETVYQQKTILDMTDKDEEVVGDFPRGEGELIMLRSKVHHTSLVEIRASFRSEILKSAERY